MQRRADGSGLLDALRAAHQGAPALTALAPEGYARDHAAFEALSDQRTLIAAHLTSRLAARATGPVAVLSVGCGDGSLDAQVALAAVDVDPERDTIEEGSARAQAQVRFPVLGAPNTGWYARRVLILGRI